MDFRVHDLCEELAQAFIECEPPFTGMTDISAEQQNAICLRLANAIAQAAEDEATAIGREWAGGGLGPHGGA